MDGHAIEILRDRCATTIDALSHEAPFRHRGTLLDLSRKQLMQTNRIPLGRTGQERMFGFS